MTFRSIIPVACALMAVSMAVPVQGQEADSPYVNFVEDVSNAGTSAAAFLQIGVGARAMAMGNAGTTLARDATALYWNPAAAANLTAQATVTFDHTDWLVDTIWILSGWRSGFRGQGPLV